MKSVSTKWKLKSATLFIMLLSIMAIPNLSSSQQMKTMTFDGGADGGAFMLQEIGGLVINSDNGITLQMVLPPDQRADAYKAIDLQENDLIKMVNGKKIENVAQLQELYDALKIGDEIKFGIKRDKKMMIVGITKADPEDLPGQMMVMTFDTDMPGPILAMIGIGIIFGESDNGVTVDKVMDDMAKQHLEKIPQAGDLLLKIQDKEITKGDDVPNIYDSFSIGEKVELLLSHDGEQYSVSFTKPENTDGPITIQQTEHISPTVKTYKSDK